MRSIGLSALAAFLSAAWLAAFLLCVAPSLLTGPDRLRAGTVAICGLWVFFAVLPRLVHMF
jgi:hypothetical protein